MQRRTLHDPEAGQKEAKMAITIATIADVLEYEPNIQDYGIFNWDDALAKGKEDVLRELRIKWFPTQQIGKYDITVIGLNVEMDEDKLSPAQLKRAHVYRTLAYYIFPRLTKFEPEIDVFERQMEFYRGLYREEIDAVIADGVEYDIDGDGTINDLEREPSYFGRLRR